MPAARRSKSKSVVNKITQQDQLRPSRSRLSEAKSARHLLPFYRAQEIDDVSLYWLPVEQYPIKYRQREWMLAFLEELTNDLHGGGQEAENFLQVKYTRTVLNDRFVQTMFEYRPMTGLLLAPGQQLPEVPTSMEIKELTESHGPEGTINIDHLAPDYCAWFAGKQSAEQRRDFFGVGGMLLLWLDAGQEPDAPKIDIPRVIATHPAMKGVDFEGQMRNGKRLQHPFLKYSREVFGAHLTDGPAKRHAAFILPHLRTDEWMGATPDQRAAWFELFSAYCVESERDRGVLLALKDPEFDERLVLLTERVEQRLGAYPG